ncbi:hypothetical protein AVEN_49815-1 [Araneus ventricosus]|uniref:Uncharacterized protein n=1 Tax=Araneus ventricosus TaxID=182803 RepID=A0A4Y2JNF2_ARAVE|nr:hypothetical protein AVEN_49815-1 [Araneus ventricosus]
MQLLQSYQHNETGGCTEPGGSIIRVPRGEKTPKIEKTTYPSVEVNRAVGSGINVGHIDELENGLSRNDVVLKGGMNSGKLCLVEDSGSGGFGLPSGVVAVLNYDGLDLRKLRSKSCDQEKLLASKGEDFVIEGIVKVFGLTLSPNQEVSCFGS